MKELLLYMAKNLVDDPESVTVTEIDSEDGNGNRLGIIHQILCHIQQRFLHLR